MIKFYPPDPNDSRSKGIKAKLIAPDVIWVEIGPEWVHKEPRPAPPISDDDIRRTPRGE